MGGGINHPFCFSGVDDTFRNTCGRLSSVIFGMSMLLKSVNGITEKQQYTCMLK